MSALSDYLEGQIIDFWFRNDANTITAPATVYVALHTAAPGDDGAANEVTAGGNSYARQSAAWDAPSGGVTQNTAEVRFDDMPAVTVTHFSIWDASTAGNCLISTGDVTPDETMGAGDNLVFPAGSLSITLA